VKPTPQLFNPEDFESFYQQGPDPYGYKDKNQALENWRVRVSVAARLLEFARERGIGRWPVARLLDFGCGEGITLKSVIESTHMNPYRIAGCDASKTAVSRCREKAFPEGAETDFRVVALGWGNELPWENESFDLVQVFGVLYSFKREEEELRAALAELVRVTAEGGLLLLMHIETSSPQSADGYRTSLKSLDVEPVLEHRFHAGSAGLTRGVIYRRGGVA